MIELKHVQKVYPMATPLKDVTVTINEGDIISVIGPSGTGKSTLLRCINMLDPPTSGKIIVDGETITDKKYDLKLVRRKIGMVFQSFNLFNHLTVIENVITPQIDLLGKSRQEAYNKGMELLNMVDMGSRAFQYPSQLSGGQKQRVAIARTVAMSPEIILFDEPTSALDPTMVGEVQSVIRSLAKNGATMMIVTHEMKFAREICNRVFYMDQGGVYEVGSPEQIFDNPVRDRTRRFIRHLKVLELTIDSKQFDFLGALSQIEEYCYKNEMTRKSSLHTEGLFEELCREILFPELKDEVNIHVVFEYDSQTAALSLDVRYNGKHFEPKQSENKIALAIVENFVSEFKYEPIDEAPYTNKVILKMKNYTNTQ